MTNRNTGANRHGIPRRGGNPEQCIWPTCPRPIGIYEGTRMCSDHALEVGTLVRRHVLRVELIQMKRIKDFVEATHKARNVIKTPPGRVRDSNANEPTIYFLRVGSYIKIGWTSDLQKRMRGYPPDSLLMAVQPGTRDDEQKLHKRFAVHPVSVDFGAKPVEVPQPRDKQYIGGPVLKSRLLRG